jgi:4-diphosphocytidyl-2-C-methyl-D-erythritol kinase
LAGSVIVARNLKAMAATLGSDVPFFLEGGTATAEGRGTEIRPLQDLAEEPILVVSPGVHVATGPAYAALGRKLTFTGSSSSISNFNRYVRELQNRSSAVKAYSFSANDFEPVVFGQYPQLKAVQDRLRRLHGDARLTGSGSALFALFRRKSSAEHGRRVLKGEDSFRGMQVVLASLVSGARYQRMWRRQLKEHLAQDNESWPPRSRYVQ